MTHETAYARAGVDIAAGDRAVELMKEHVAGTRRPEVLGGLGGFAGFFDAATFKDYRHPVLATSTDGVGTKVDIARRMKVYDTIGFDLMGMLVDDLVVVGAEPLFVTDYISCGHVDPEVIASIVKGIAQACQKAGCALLGGETAEHPGLLAPDEFDVAGATTGVVERDEILGPERIAEGDALIAVASSGLHSNGYSLVRHVLLEQAGWTLDRHVDELGRTVGEELLEPTIVYAADLLALAHHSEVHAMCHVTGGGLANNLTRVMPSHLTATNDPPGPRPPSSGSSRRSEPSHNLILKKPSTWASEWSYPCRTIRCPKPWSSWRDVASPHGNAAPWPPARAPTCLLSRCSVGIPWTDASTFCAQVRGVLWH